MRDGGKARAEYRTVCSQKDSIHLFILDWWLDAACGADNWEVLLSHAENGHVQGALVVYVKSRYGVRYITPPPFTQYTGIWLDYPGGISSYKKRQFEKKVCTDLIDQLEAYAKENRIAFAQFHLAPQYTNWLPFLWRGYRQTTYYTFRVQIDDMDRAFSMFVKTRRRKVRVAEQALYTEIATAEDLYAFDVKARETHGQVLKYNFEFFNTLYRASWERGKLYPLLLKAKESGKPSASAFVVCDSDNAYLLAGSYDRSGRDEASTYRMYESMRMAQKQVGCFDFEGSIVEEYATNYGEFGTEQVPYFAMQKIFTRNPLLRLLLKLRLY